MFPELYFPIGYVFLISLLLLRDEYLTRRINKKRLDARAELSWPVSVETIAGPIYGHTENISASGALLVCPQPLCKGEIVRVVLNAPSRPIEAEAEVVWIDRYLPTEKYYPYNAIAVQFKRITDESRSFLALVVHNRLNDDKRS